jgi:hypothetical protein
MTERDRLFLPNPFEHLTPTQPTPASIERRVLSALSNELQAFVEAQHPPPRDDRQRYRR